MPTGNAAQCAEQTQITTTNADTFMALVRPLFSRAIPEPRRTGNDVNQEGIRPVSGRFQAFSGRQFHGMSSSMRLIL